MRTLMLAVFLIAIGLPSLAKAQDREKKSTDLSIEKRLATLEAEIAAIKKEMAKVAKETPTETTPTLVPIDKINAKEAAKILKAIYGTRPGFKVTRLKEMKVLLIVA